MEKIINVLAKFGLSTYESKAYITMCSMINGKAIDISEASGIPRSKIYDVLKELNKKGFVEVERTKPLKYTVVTPKVVFEREREKIEAELKQLLEEIAELKEASSTKTQEEIQEELGDVLFSVVNLARHLKVDPVLALALTNEKFKRRFSYVEEKMESSGIEMKQENLEIMDKFWDEGKGLGLQELYYGKTIDYHQFFSYIYSKMQFVPFFILNGYLEKE